MNSTKSLGYCFAIRSLVCCTPGGWNKSFGCVARRVNTYVEKLGLAKMACVLFVFCAVTAIVSPAQTFTALDAFDWTNGAYPGYVALVQGTGGNFYGTTSQGANACYDAFGENIGCGTVFEMTSGGEVPMIYDFCSQTNCPDGSNPEAGLVQGTDGNFYGATSGGGAYCGGTYGSVYGCGTVFKITPAGVLTTLYNFCSQPYCSDGAAPLAALVQGTDGNFYGTTYSGGLTTSSEDGTVFEITPAGKLTTLHRFCSETSCADGEYPYAGLVQGTNGNFYGTTYLGGANGRGTVFKINPAGTLTTLYSFCSQTNCSDGQYPFAGLVQGTDGNFYGTTPAGGTFGDGTIFQITSAGAFTTLYSFCSASGCTDGSYPYAGLVQGTDGAFYGTTSGGGANGYGTVFKISPALGEFTTLYSFTNAFGAYPFGGLLQATNGNFYGTTQGGGDFGDGTTFSLSVGLGPFVETLPTSGREGAKIGILGQGFDSSSVVKFGGVQAKTVKLTGTILLTAAVPAGALTGSVTVTTGATTLTSNRTFRVTPQIKSFTPSDGPDGTVVTITGTGLKQTSKVTLDGMKAIHTVVSDSEVTANVPTGAKTGKIAITTPGGTATSSTSFTVTE